jgi:hypothetical protein
MKRRQSKVLPLVVAALEEAERQAEGSENFAAIRDPEEVKVTKGRAG